MQTLWYNHQTITQNRSIKLDGLSGLSGRGNLGGTKTASDKNNDKDGAIIAYYESLDEVSFENDEEDEEMCSKGIIVAPTKS